MNADRPKNTSSSKTKQLAFKAVAILLPLILVFVLELGLRLFNYGHDLSLFVEDKDCKDCWVSNKYVSLRYFSDSVNATIGNAEPFKKVKPKGTIRIFVIGESTTIGFPYMHNGSFHRWLKYRLLQMYPGVNFEVVNLSLTAVNSFTVNDIGKELVSYDPDAVCIYTGHNEYYGALGAASTSAFGGNNMVTKWLIGIRHYRLFQLLANTYNSLASHGKPDTRKTLMERMVKDPEIAFESPAYYKSIQNFHDNISEVCERLSTRHIPVFLSTIVSNEKDLKPLRSGDKKLADDLYQQANMACQQGQFAEAKAKYIAAKDQDVLRFRAPGAINAQIIKLAASDPNITLVDSYQLFGQNSLHGIIGNGLLLEHVHPNLQGYALLSEAFFRSLYKAKVLPQKGAVNVSFDALKAGMPVTKMDSAFGAYSIHLLRKQWPFNEKVHIEQPNTIEEQLGYDLACNRIKWTDAMSRLMDHYEQQNDMSQMLKVAEAVMLEYPFDPTFYLAAGELCIKLSDLNKASNYLYRAFNLKPDMKIAQSIYAVEVKQRHLKKALAMVDFGLAQTPSRQLTAVKQILTRMGGLDDQIRRGIIPAKNPELAAAYTMLGEPQNAKYYE